MSMLRQRYQLAASATRYRAAAWIVLGITLFTILVIALGGREAPTFALLFAIFLTFEFPIIAALILFLIAALYEIAAGAPGRTNPAERRQGRDE